MRSSESIKLSETSWSENDAGEECRLRQTKLGFYLGHWPGEGGREVVIHLRVSKDGMFPNHRKLLIKQLGLEL